jgi:protein tyrosine phosphatase (PTP) superfamily phosphohydrolase (DUF442 family)
MRHRASHILIPAALLLAALASAQAPTVQPAAPAASAPLLLNARNPLPGLLTGGATNEVDELSRLAAAGYRTYVDLRSDQEVKAEIGPRAEVTGIAYWRLPVTGEGELDLTTARALAAILGDHTRYPIALACASGNRSGALLAVKAFWLDATRADAALELGQRAGLTRLEPSVRVLLGLPPAAPPPVGEAVH